MNKTKQLTMIGMLCAIAYLAMAFLRVPVVSFLKYDPKDVIIVIGGFIMGPLASFVISFIVSLIEMFTVSETGVIGLIMNVISTCSFACTAALIYKKIHSISGAVIGLAIGTLTATAVMLLWNYIMAPIYMHVTRDAVAAMLIPIFLPFNLVKGMLNTAFTLILYKPVITALRKAGLVEPLSGRKHDIQIGIYAVGIFLLVTGILSVLVLRNII